MRVVLFAILLISQLICSADSIEIGNRPLVLKYFDGTPVQSASVRTSQYVFFSDFEGKVQGQFSEGEIFEVSHVNAKDSFEFHDSIKVYYLSPKTYILPEVSKSPLPSRALFSHGFATMPEQKSLSYQIKERYGLLDQGEDLKAHAKSNQAGIVMNSPISFFYNKYSQSAKELRKVAKLENWELNENSLKNILTDQVVYSLTNGQFESIPFLNYCSFHPDLLNYKSRLDLLVMARQCYLDLQERSILLNNSWSSVYFTELIRY